MKWKISLFALCLAAPAWAAVDTTMPPGGVFGLKPGIYAPKGASCSKAAPASVKVYDGKALYTPPSRVCIARVTSKDGSRHTITQSCLNKDTGTRSQQTYIVRTTDALNFSLRTDAGVVSYSYCPAYDLPSSLEGLDPNTEKTSQ